MKWLIPKYILSRKIENKMLEWFSKDKIFHIPYISRQLEVNHNMLANTKKNLHGILVQVL